jgi:hypothetical protein
VERGREGRFRIGVVTAYDYTVITADRHFAESGDAALLLTAMKGRQIRLPNKQNVWPARKHLEWHRNHTFLG